jgi:hypothetical protein
MPDLESGAVAFDIHIDGIEMRLIFNGVRD